MEKIPKNVGQTCDNITEKGGNGNETKEAQRKVLMSKAVEDYRSYWDDFAEVEKIMAQKKAKKVKPKKNMSPVVTGGKKTKKKK